MNIVKLNDILMSENYSIAKLFNTQLKGKYAYWIKMRYIFPLSSLDYKTYIKYEQMTDIQLAGTNILPHIDLYSEECCMLEFAQRYIDASATEDANSICDFKLSNAYSTDYDVDINKLKSFRTWLASELLLMNTDENNQYMGKYTALQTHMLEYYKNNMYNDIVKYLDIFGNSYTPSFSNSLGTACACCSTSNTVNDLISIDTCNALETYKKNIYAFMVDTFSDIEFWKACNKSFLTLFKKYIDNIITINLTLQKDVETSYNVNLYATCNCSSNSNDSFKIILNNLSTAIQYIIDDDIVGHKNFIYDAFNSWCTNAYEKMNWK